MRLFLAIDAGHKEYFSDLQQQIRMPQVRCTFPKEFHLTLKFIGDVEQEDVQGIEDVVSQLPWSPFELSTQKVVIAPSEQRIHTIWIGVKESPVLMALQQQVEKKLRSLREEKREFHPHITLARVKNIKDEFKADFLKQVKAIIAKPLVMKVSSMFLIASELTPEGPRYRVLKEFKASG